MRTSLFYTQTHRKARLRVLLRSSVIDFINLQLSRTKLLHTITLFLFTYRKVNFNIHIREIRSLLRNRKFY